METYPGSDQHWRDASPSARAEWLKFSKAVFDTVEREGLRIKTVGPHVDMLSPPRVDDDDEDLRAAQEEIRANPKSPLVAEHLPMIAKGLVEAMRGVLKPMHEKQKASDARIAELELALQGKAASENEMLRRIAALEKSC